MLEDDLNRELRNLVHLEEVFACEGVEDVIPPPFFADWIAASATSSKEDFISSSSSFLVVQKKSSVPDTRSAGISSKIDASSFAVYFFTSYFSPSS